MDLVDFPSIVANRVLKRLPLNIVFVRKHLVQRQREQQYLDSLLSHPLSPSDKEEQEGEGEGEAQSRQFEDALPVGSFTQYSWRMRRTVSDPRHNN